MADHDLLEAKSLLFQSFVPASKFFCDQRCLKFQNKPSLKTHFNKILKDTRVRQLSSMAQSELSTLVHTGLTYISRGSMNADRIWKIFLGGMSEGQSVGLRKWFSKHSQGLNCVSKLEKITSNSKSYSEAEWRTLRKTAAALKNEITRAIPSWAQKDCTGHPHLPFWSRLFMAIGYLANYDPGDDDVVEMVPISPSRSATTVHVLDSPGNSKEVSQTHQSGTIIRVGPTACHIETMNPKNSTLNQPQALVAPNLNPKPASTHAASTTAIMCNMNDANPIVPMEHWLLMNPMMNIAMYQNAMQYASIQPTNSSPRKRPKVRTSPAKKSSLQPTNVCSKVPNIAPVPLNPALYSAEQYTPKDTLKPPTTSSSSLKKKCCLADKTCDKYPITKTEGTVDEGNKVSQVPLKRNQPETVDLTFSDDDDEISLVYTKQAKPKKKTKIVSAFPPW